jgi:tetratricopeptide (TPR) repeat protein
MERALALDGAEPVASFRLAMLKEIEGDLRGALQLYQQSLGRGPDNTEAYAKIGGVYRAMNQPAEALRYIERAEQMGLRSVGLFVDKGVVLAMLGRAREARSAWETALALNPSPEMAAGIRRNLETLSQQQ